MPDHYRKALQKREGDVDYWAEEATRVKDRQGILSLRLEKTIIIAASAIVEAIWKSRY